MKKAMVLLFFYLLLTGCQSNREFAIQKLIPNYTASTQQRVNETYSEYIKKGATFDSEHLPIIQSKAFIIAENLIQSLCKEKTLKTETTYFCFEKQYTDLETYNFCFIQDAYIKNGGFPCVEVEKETGKVLRISIAGKNAQNETLFVVPAISLPGWTERHLSDVKSLASLGIVKSNLSYALSQPPLWVDKINVNYDWMILNADDLLAGGKAALLNYEGVVSIHPLKNRTVASVFFKKDFKSLGRYCVYFDNDSGQILGYEFME